MKLLPFQQKILADTKHRNRVAYYLDMGLGKTFVGAEKLYRLDERKNLVICQKSKIDDWVSHFETYYLPFFDTFDLTKKKDYEAFLQSDGFCVGVINYDLAFRRKELLDLTDFTLMLDESQFIKNDKAKRTKFIQKLDATNVILLSGTPTGGRYEELWTQCRLLGWSISKTAFWDRYINYRLYSPAPNVYPIKIVTGYKNVNDLKQSLKLLGAVFLKTDEVMELPNQVFTSITVPVNREYKSFMNNGIVEVDGAELVGDNILKKLLYARQLCSTYSKEKLAAFKDWIESNDSRLIVFYNFTSELNHLLEVIDDSRPVSIVNGQTKDLEAYEKYDNSITLIQYQSGATGLNLQKANYVAYYSPPLSSELYEQSKKRIHRIGQSQTCFYYQFICKNSVEEQIYNTLNERRDYTELLFSKEYFYA